MKRILLVPVLVVALLACDVAQWVQTAEQILPVVLPMVTNLITAVSLLEGKTVSAADLNTITRTATEVSNDLNLAGQLVNQYQSSPNATTVQKINAALSDVTTNLNALLPALQISDPATVQKITAVVTLISSEVSSIQQILPVVQSGKLTAKRVTASGLLNAGELKKQYNTIVTAPTANPAVTQAFAGAALK